MERERERVKESFAAALQKERQKSKVTVRTVYITIYGNTGWAWYLAS